MQQQTLERPGIEVFQLVEGIFYWLKEGFYLYRPSTRDIFVNRRLCDLFGMECQLSTREARLWLLPPEISAIFRKKYDFLFTGEEGREFVQEIELMDGNRTTISFSRSLFSQHQEEFFVGVIRSMSEYLSLEKKREEATRLFHHDMRNYVGNIQALLAILGESLKQEEAEMIAHVRSSGERILKMIEMYLENYRLEEGAFRLQLYIHDLMKVLEDLKARFSPLSAEKRVPIHIGPKSSVHEDWEILCDSLLVDRMLSNLLRNALEASPPENPVTIGLKREDDQIKVTIRNRGAVPEKIRDTFFEKYATSGSGGVGLGTYGAKLIARAHGGDISMWTSEKEDRTEVVIMLPTPHI